MLGIVLHIIALVYAARVPRILRSTADEYPARDQGLFDEWRRKELSGIYILLAATWGLSIVIFGLAFFLALARVIKDRDDAMVAILSVIQLVLMLAGLIWSAIMSSQANNIKKRLQIPGQPVGGGVYPRQGPIVNMPAPPPSDLPSDPPKFDA